MHVVVGYPNRDEELAIIELDNRQQTEKPKPPASPLKAKDIFAARQAVSQVHIDQKLYGYIADLVLASRNPADYDSDLKRWCRFGASPRASIALARCARAVAWLDDMEYVTPEHIQKIAPDVLRHRILLTFEAEADGITTDDFGHRLLEVVAIP